MGVVLGQDGANAEIGRVEVGVVVTNELLELAGVLGGRVTGLDWPRRRRQGSRASASVKATREDIEAKVGEDVIEFPIGPLGLS